MQARMQLLAVSHVFDLDEVFVWGRDDEKVKTYVSEMEQNTQLVMTPCSTASECVKDADIIITTTPSKQPLFSKEDVKPGTYRIVHYGDYKNGWNHKIYPFTGTSDEFDVK